MLLRIPSIYPEVKNYHVSQTTSNMQTLNTKHLLSIKHIFILLPFPITEQCSFIIINCWKSSWILKQSPIFQRFYFTINVTKPDIFVAILINIMLSWISIFSNCAKLVWNFFFNPRNVFNCNLHPFQIILS